MVQTEVAPTRFGHSAIVHKDQFYIFGGHNGTTALAEVWTLDLNGGRGWTLLAPTEDCLPPSPRLYHSAAVFEESVFVYGGCEEWDLAEGKPLKLLKDCFEFLIDTREWRPVEIRGNTPILCGHTAEALHESMLVIGGEGGEMAEPTSLHILNFATGSWTYVSPKYDDLNSTSATLARRFHCSAVYNNHLFVLFGDPEDDLTASNGVIKLHFVHPRNALRSVSMPLLQVRSNSGVGASSFLAEKANTGDFPIKSGQATPTSTAPTSAPVQHVHHHRLSGHHSVSQPILTTIINGTEAASSSEVCFKCHLGKGTIRLVSAPRQIAYSRFMELLENCLFIQTVDIQVHYKDEEDDMILVKSQADLDEAILQAEMDSSERSIMVRIFLSKSNGDPPERIDADFLTALSFPVSTFISPKPSPTLSFPFIGSPSTKRTFRPRRITPTRFRKGFQLGSSDHSKVVIAMDSESGCFAAVKTVERDMITHPKTEADLASRVNSFSKFDHPHVASYYTVLFVSRSLDIYVEYASGGSLHDLLAKFGALSETIIQSYTRQILLGLQFLHEKDLPHGALICSNILLDNTGVIKLCDYFISQFLSPETTSHSGSGGPEQISLALRKDIWDTGLIVLAMLVGNPTTTFSTKDNRPPAIPESVSPDAQDLLMRCFLSSPTGNSATELLQHPFLNPRPRTKSQSRIRPFVS